MRRVCCWHTQMVVRSAGHRLRLGKAGGWERMRPVIPSFSSPDLFAAWEGEHEPAPAARAAWFSPGGFQAFEHFWALPQAIGFHQNIGPARITARTHELNGQMKEGLARMPR